MNKNSHIDLLEERLEIKFPKTYRMFLKRHGSAIVGGYKICGIPTKDVSMSVLEATQLLRKNRPDLNSKKLLAVCIKENRALCLDLDKDSNGDPFTLSVPFNKKEKIVPGACGTFQKWMDFHRNEEIRFKKAYQRVASKRNEVQERFKKKFGDRKRAFVPRPKHWHPIISEVKDFIVGLTALRYNPVFNCLEVDEFYPRNPPNHKKGGAVRHLASLIFVMARDFSGSLEIIFTKDRPDGKENFFRPRRKIPGELIALAKEYGITFKGAKDGKISHQEGVELFFAILELSEKAKQKVLELERANYISRELVAEIAACNIWSPQEITWILENAERPEALLLGTDLPENRIYYANSLDFGRSTLLAKRFQSVVLNQITDGFSSEELELPKCDLKPSGGFWTLSSPQRFKLPWMIDRAKEVWVDAEEDILLLSRTAMVGSAKQSQEWIEKNIKLLEKRKREQGFKKACLLLNFEFKSKDFDQDEKGLKELAEKASSRGIYVLSSYERCDQLDLEVEKRMNQVRRMCRFPLKKVPISLAIFEIEPKDWKKNKLFSQLVRLACDYGGLIGNKVDIKRFRNDFTIACLGVERMGMQLSKKEPVFLTGEENSKLIEALKDENGISYPFVKPEKMKNIPFIKNVRGGIVVVSNSYTRINAPIVPAVIPRYKAEVPDGFFNRIEKDYEKAKRGTKSVLEKITRSLSEGLPFSASYSRPNIFAEVIRDFIYQKVSKREIKKRFLFFFKLRKMIKFLEPENPAHLRIIYGDESEGEAFPLFSLNPEFKPKQGLYEFPAQLVSFRHMMTDYVTEVCIIRNVEIQNKEDSADQEEFAFRKVFTFSETFFKLIKGEIDLKKAEEYGLIFRVLWNSLSLEKEIPKPGLKLHLFLSTGLEPAVIGALRAGLEMVKKYRGEFILIPRVYMSSVKLNEEFKKIDELDLKTKEELISQSYRLLKEWY